MRNDHDGHAALAVELLEQAQDGQRRMRVQRRGGLITQQNGGFGSQRTGNRHTLTLAARKLRRIGVRAVRQADGIECFTRPGVPSGGRNPGHFQRKLDVVQRCAM